MTHLPMGYNMTKAVDLRSVEDLKTLSVELSPLQPIYVLKYNTILSQDTCTSFLLFAINGSLFDDECHLRVFLRTYNVRPIPGLGLLQTGS